MKILVISDVHGNLPALEKVLALEKDADLCISLGDVVNYGPWSNECVQLLNTLPNKILLKGNHEKYFLEKKYENTAAISYQFYLHCLPQFTQATIIKDYATDFEMNDYYFVHTIQDQYIFPDTEVEIKQHTVIGHSHRQFIRSVTGHQLINPGSVGQNRIIINQINYALWDGGTHWSLKSAAFDLNLIINQFKSDQYPQVCIDYYLSKKTL